MGQASRRRRIDHGLHTRTRACIFAWRGRRPGLFLRVPPTPLCYPLPTRHKRRHANHPSTTSCHRHCPTNVVAPPRFLHFFHEYGLSVRIFGRRFSFFFFFLDVYLFYSFFPFVTLRVVNYNIIRQQYTHGRVTNFR